MPVKLDRPLAPSASPARSPVRLTPEAASHICMHECRSLCCRGPLYLRLEPTEAKVFRTRGDALGVEVDLVEGPDGFSTVSFLEHPGQRCPMLDPVTSACRIYDARPQRCRDFPDAPRPDCAISTRLLQ